MKSFFKKKIDNFPREKVVKQSLTNELKSRVEDVLLGRKEEDGFYVTNEEGGTNLCLILEAIFVHGVKESISDKMAAALGDPDTKPTPEFWSPMMVFSHRQIIDQINNMSQIANDVGRCRAWIRIALNDGLFLSYMQTISQQNRAIYPYYKKSAYLRDLEFLGIAINVLQGLARFTFKFPVNSNYLNYWPDTPLLLAGLWTPPMKYCPISTGVDLAKNISTSARTERASELLAYDVPISKRLLNDEDALNVILNTPIEGSPLQTRIEREKMSTDDESFQSSEEISSTSDFKQISGDSAKLELTESYIESRLRDKEAEQSGNDVNQLEENEIETKVTVNVTAPAEIPKHESYDKVWDGYNPSTKSPFDQLNEQCLEDFLSNYEPSIQISSPIAENAEDKEMGFEIVRKSSLPTTKQDFKILFLILSRGLISLEVGLDSQQFACKKCGILIGLGSKKAKPCSFTGFYFCEECFGNCETVIPARILHNWDFAKYGVSLTSANFLADVRQHPLLNLRKINPKIYFAVPDIDAIQQLRIKLNLLRPYLFSCHDPIKNRIRQLLWPRDYLYEHVHLYSVADLEEISTGFLLTTLRKAVNLSVDHVKSCSLCLQKGFICEICSAKTTKDETPKPIFPFDDLTHRCSTCCSVFHLTCYQEKDKVCPKCARIEIRKAKLERHVSEDS